MNNEEIEAKRKARNTAYVKEWREKHREQWNATIRKRRRKVRNEILWHYSNGTMQCACCGEKYVEFLGIDHINGGGLAHRKKLGGGSPNLYQWLRKNNYPLGFRILCFNCNFAIAHYGYCPHQIAEKE